MKQKTKPKNKKLTNTLMNFLKSKSPLFNKFIIPITSIILFLGIWYLGAEYLRNREINFRVQKVMNDQGVVEAKALKTCFEANNPECQTNTLPSPIQVWTSVKLLVNDYYLIRKDKEDFLAKTEVINRQREAAGESPIIYTGRPSFVDIVFTSLKTVFAGFLLAFFIAVPIGVFIGLSNTLRSTFNWFIQVFKPVSPVVWYLLVFMVVKTLLIETSSDNSFIISFISVGLCSMWATLVNTTMGVSSVDKDYINVSKVLKLKPLQKVFKIVLPSSLPLIFTGLRITLSVAWMVLIAIELLAQSPGLGLFVWEEFQNGANDSNSKIIVAMFVIGIIGFLLDRMMLFVQNMISYNKNSIA